MEVNDKYAFKILEVDAGHRLSLQYHNEKLETMYCLYGCGTLLLSEHGIDREVIMTPGLHVTINPGVIHRLEASSTSPLVIMEASSPELDDVVRIDDDYKREQEND